MFILITWFEYWIGISAVMACYYLTVMLVFYRKDSRLFKGSKFFGKVEAGNNKSEKVPHYATETGKLRLSNVVEPIPDNSDDEFAFSACAGELLNFFEQPQVSGFARADLLKSLHRLLSKYTASILSNYRETVNELILVYAQEYCSIHLSKVEVEGVWRLDE